MRTLLTKYDLLVYWNCSKGYSRLCSGTTNEIIQWRIANGYETDDPIRRVYGNNAYTHLIETGTK
jgi:hypothetical protein